MPDADFRSPRLYVEPPLAAAIAVPLSRDQANYLGNVLRLGAGDTVLAFNGRDGEWRAAISGRKRPDALIPVSQMRKQTPLPDLAYVFAPLKHARLDYVVQKAVEMGAGRIAPVLTRHTQVSRVNVERMRANAIEAAQQCGVISLAQVDAPLPLQTFLDTRPSGRRLVFCDEAAEITDPAAALRASGAAGGIDVLIGPEGGFSDDERTVLLRQPDIVRLALGPRILRADTAGVAALALVQAVCGDWRPR